MICTEALHSRTLPHARWPPDRDRRIDSNRPTQPSSLAARIACLSFWKQRCFYFFDWSKIRSEADSPSRSLAFRWRRSLELFSRTPLHRLASVANSDCELWYCLKLNFPFFFLLFPFFTMQAWCFQGWAKHFDRDSLSLKIRMNLSSRRAGEIELRMIVDHRRESHELLVLINYRRKETKKWQHDWTNVHVQPPASVLLWRHGESLAFRTLRQLFRALVGCRLDGPSSCIVPGRSLVSPAAPLNRASVTAWTNLHCVTFRVLVSHARRTQVSHRHRFSSHAAFMVRPGFLFC